MLHSSTGAALIWTAVVYQLTMSSNAQNHGPSGYLGCFKDWWAGGRSLGGDSTTSGSLSVEWCFNYCLNIKAYKYAGVESETECYCGNNEDYDSRGKVADSECRDTCPDNSNQLCGGHWRLAIYQISRGICNNAIGPPVHGSHEVKNPTHVSFNLQNSKFFGTRVIFKCDTGYVIEGAEAINCIQIENKAKWSHSVPTCTVPSPLPTSMNQTASMATNSTNATTSSAVQSSSTDATDWQEMSNQLTTQTGTVVGTVAGVIAALVILPVIVIIIFRRRGNKRNASSDVAMVDVTSTINQKQGDSDVTTEPNQASTTPVYSQVIRDQTKNENDHVYANPNGMNSSAASVAYEVNLDIWPSSNEHDNETGLVDNILYDSSSLKDKSETRETDLNEEHAGALTMTGQPGWVKNIIYE